MKKRINSMNMNTKQSGKANMEDNNKKEWITPELQTLDVQETAQLPPPEPS
ncbi:MAG TPA: hypothetical protein VJ941_10625 [Gracilimonas sp.]|nr:hypothetical protein [Gracilimonas sp.]